MGPCMFRTFALSRGSGTSRAAAARPIIIQKAYVIQVAGLHAAQAPPNRPMPARGAVDDHAVDEAPGRRPSTDRSRAAREPAATTLVEPVEVILVIEKRAQPVRAPPTAIRQGRRQEEQPRGQESCHRKPEGGADEAADRESPDGPCDLAPTSPITSLARARRWSCRNNRRRAPALTVNAPTMTEGIASSHRAARVTTHGLLVRRDGMMGPCVVRAHGRAASVGCTEPLLPWNVMKSNRKLYSAVTNTPSSTHQYAYPAPHGARPPPPR